jgi:uncharacterized protein (TIGR02246 family)
MKTLALMTVMLASPLVCAQNPSDSKEDLKRFVAQVSSARNAIADGYLKWIDATKAQDVEAVVALYTDDAVMLPNHADTASGEEAIRAFYRQWYGGKDKLIRENFVDTGLLMNSPDLAIEMADFSGSTSLDGKETEFRGKNLIVWKRQSDGSWKILRDLWNSSSAQWLVRAKS